MAKTPPSRTKSKTKSGAVRPEIVKDAASKPARRRETLASLRADLENIIERLHQADDLTQKSVISLQMAFTALERRVSQEGPINKAALTLRVDQLTEHLTKLIKETQTFVSEELRAAQINPSLGKLKTALSAAEDRLAHTEIAQANALSKVNHHIAQIAKAVDVRFVEEAKANKASLDALDQSLRADLADMKSSTDERLDAIEVSSAKAILGIGEKVISLSDDIKEKTEKQSQQFSDKIAAIAEKTQKDFGDYTSGAESVRKQLERRVESLEENQRNLDSYTDRNLSAITTRLDNLEYGLTQTSPPVVGAAPAGTKTEKPADNDGADDDAFSAQPYSAPTPKPTIISAPNIPAPSLTLVPQSSAPQSSPLSLPDAYTAQPSAAFMPTEYNPDATAEPDNTPFQTMMPTTAQPVTTPEPISTPEMSRSSVTVPVNISDSEIPTKQEEFRSRLLTPPAAGHNIDAAAVTFRADAGPAINSAEIGADDLPYADPAYAEQPNVEVVRPGSFAARKKEKANRPGLGARKKQVAVAAILLATVGYFALRGSPDFTTRSPVIANADANQNMFVDETTGSAPVAPQDTGAEGGPENLSGGNGLEDTEAAAQAVDDVVVATTEPAVGTYQDNQGLNPDGAPAAPATLEAAAKQGDPVAEFQLGLARLQSGDTKEAMALIRSAANKGQPAAQYRLAKFYEAGEGVSEDATVARQLTERAARSGNRIAMHDLALYYAEGRGDVKVDIKTAAKWFEKAAQRGVVDSQYNLGVLFESGQGIPKNLKEAYIWYSVAAAQGDQFARKQVRLLSGQLSKEDLNSANARVKKFRPTSLDEEANGIFRNVAWTVPGQKMAIKKQIAETQTLLGQLGYDAGGADGAMGPKTRLAIKSFQKDKGLSPTGKVNAQLVIELQRAAGA